MPREFNRSQRVASQMRKELAIIFQSDIKDPRLGFITINEVDLSRDLSVAKVYFTVLGKDRDEVGVNQEIVERSIPFIRHTLGKRMKMRTLPALRFLHDDSVERGLRIDRLLHESNSTEPQDR